MYGSSYPFLRLDTSRARLFLYRFNLLREIWHNVLYRTIHPEAIVDVMIASEIAWEATRTFAKRVIENRKSRFR